MRVSLAAAIVASVVGISANTMAQAAVRRDTSIAPQTLAPALHALMKEHEFQIIYSSELLQGRQSQGASGDLTLEEALILLLRDTNLTYRFLDEHTVTILSQDTPPVAGPASQSNDSRAATEESVRVPAKWSSRFRLAQVANESHSGVTSSPGTNPRQLEEIVVTAQKRQQAAVDVAASLAVFGGAELREKGISTFDDLALLEPNVDFDYGGGSRSLLSLSIRGINPGGVRVANGNPSAAVHTDGIYLASSSYLVGQMFDVERVEVLKGPQGTIYGRNATAGVVNIISRRPSDDFEANVQADYGRFGGPKVEGGIGGPITERVRARFAGYIDRGGGYFKNQGTGELAGTTPYISVTTPVPFVGAQDGLGDKDLTAARLIVEADLSEATLLTLRGSAFWDRSENLYTETNTSYYGQTPPDRDFRTINTDRRTQLDTDMKSLSMQLDHKFSDQLDFTALLGYQQLSNNDDIIFIPRQYASSVNYINDLDQRTGELRMTYRTLDGKHTFIGGVFGLQDGYAFYNRLNYRLSTNSAWDLRNDYDQQRWSYAAFAEDEWAFAPRWTLTLGARYTADKSTFEGLSENANTYGAPQMYPSLPLSFDRDFHDSQVTGRVVLGFKPSDESLIYGSVSRGYRAGGFDGTTILTPDEAEPIDSEFMWAYEVGAKLSTRTASLSGAVFYYQADDLQGATQRVVASSDGSPLLSNVLSNVAKADIYGAELSGTLMPLDRLTVRAGLGLLSSEIKSYTSNNPAERGYVGNDLPDAPSVTATGSFRYEHPLGTLPYYLFFGGDIRYTDKVFSEVSNAQAKPAYTMLNARLGLSTLDERWTLSLWGTNLLDEEYYLSLRQIPGGQIGVIGEPLSYGLSVSYSY